MEQTPASVLLAAMAEPLIDEEGEPVELRLDLAASASFADPQLADLLSRCSGFSLGSWEVSFTNLRGQGFDFLLPNWIELCGDGAGNFWVLEIPPPSRDGLAGPVWYVCHDPPAIVLIATTLAEFLGQLIDAHRPRRRLESNPFESSWDLAMQVWKSGTLGMPAEALARSADPELAALAALLGPNGLVHDTRNVRVGQGFSWEPLDAMHLVSFGKDYRVRGGRRE